MRKFVELNAREIFCLEGFNDRDQDSYYRLRDICPNHFKGFQVQAKNLIKVLEVDGVNLSDKLDGLYVLLDKLSRADLIFCESYRSGKRGDVTFSIIFTAFAGLFNDEECEACGAFLGVKHEK